MNNIPFEGFDKNKKIHNIKVLDWYGVHRWLRFLYSPEKIVNNLRNSVKNEK